MRERRGGREEGEGRRERGGGGRRGGRRAYLRTHSLRSILKPFRRVDLRHKT